MAAMAAGPEPSGPLDGAALEARIVKYVQDTDPALPMNQRRMLAHARIQEETDARGGQR